jgi:hypothetical protein
MVFYGQGGFTYSDLYNMPVNLRAFYYMKLYDIMEMRKQEAEAKHR